MKRSQQPKEAVTVRLSVPILRRLRKTAERTRRTLSSIVCEIVDTHAEKHL